MRSKLQNRESGFALVSVLVALALLTTVGVALTGMGAVEYRSAINHRSATRALLMADAGATHALALMRGALSDYTYSEILRGSDNAWDTPDDGYLSGFGLAAGDALPDTGIALELGNYSVRIINDPGDPSGDPSVDSNNQLLALCHGETPDGGVAEIGALFAAYAFPAIASNGDLIVPGTPLITGDCGGVHSNRDLIIGGVPIIDGRVSASGEAYVSGTITNSYGEEVDAYSDEPYVEVPDYDPFDFCGEADYWLREGVLVTIDDDGDEVETPLSGKPFGWQWDSSIGAYKLTAKNAVEGTVCADANVQVNGNLGAVGDTFAISILADGSVQMNGTPVVRADHSDGILIMATGDVQAGGNSSGGTPYYNGLLYSGAQCKVNGNPVLRGNVLCHDGVNLGSDTELTDENKINGNPTIQYDCGGLRQLTSIAAWWEIRAR